MQVRECTVCSIWDRFSNVPILEIEACCLTVTYWLLSDVWFERDCMGDSYTEHRPGDLASVVNCHQNM